MPERHLGKFQPAINLPDITQNLSMGGIACFQLLFVVLVIPFLAARPALTDFRVDKGGIGHREPARRESIVRIAHQSEELGDYDKFIPPEE
jgi:hypothetical protein